MTLRDQGIVASTDDQAMSLAQQACMPDEELYILLAPNSYQLYKSPDAS